MHERLSPYKTPACTNAIEALSKCHRENRFLKFFGVCNTVRSELDDCLGKEFVRRRAENYEKSKKMSDILKDLPNSEED